MPLDVYYEVVLVISDLGSIKKGISYSNTGNMIGFDDEGCSLLK